MDFRSRMKKTKADSKLKARHNSGGMKPNTKGRFPTVFNEKKIPEGIESWWCKEGKHVVDIVPFFAGPDFPLKEDMTPLTQEGEMTYKLDLFVHRNIGNMNKPYVCPFENFGEPCPICEYIKANRLDKEDWKQISAKHRVFYFVWVHDNKDQEKKGVQLWEVAGFFMEEKLEEISSLPDGGGQESFWHPDTGKRIAWTRKGTKNTEYLGHRFIPRQTPLPNRILDQTFPLDSIIEMHPSYEEIEKEFMGTLKKMNLLDDDECDNPYPDDSDTTDDTDNIDDINDDDFDSPSTKGKKKKPTKVKRRRKKRTRKE